MTLHDLAALAEQARIYARQHAPHECQAQLQGACTLRLYWDAAQSGGTADFVNWCGACSTRFWASACERQCSSKCVHLQGSQSAVL